MTLLTEAVARAGPVHLWLLKGFQQSVIGCLGKDHGYAVTRKKNDRDQYEETATGPRHGTASGFNDS
ncbi:MAG: hypothetical protein R3C24_19950 [Cyanobacteriota/Melainabacteria group bacterium]